MTTVWKVYRYHAWLGRRSLRQFALVMAGINFAAMVIVLAIAWQVVPHSWIPNPFIFAPSWTVGMTAWQTRQRHKQLNR
jgi:hypothetical protein